MAEEILVDRKLEDGKNLIRDLQAKNFDVSAAFWMQEEGGYWYLYLVSPLGGRADGYQKLSSVLRELPKTSIDVFEIQLIGTNEPLAQEVLELQSKYPLNLYSTRRLRKVGAMRVGEAHIYPLASLP